MKKNRLFFMFAALFVAAAVLFSCQKEEVVSLEDGLMLKGASSTECENCVDTWIGSMATYTNFKKGTADQTGFTLTSYNDAGKIYFTLSRIDGTFGTLVYNGVTLLDNVDPKKSSHSWTENLPTVWDACYVKSIILSLNDIPGVGNAQGTFTYYAQELCTTTALSASKTQEICVGDVITVSAAVTTKQPVTPPVIPAEYLSVTSGVLKIYMDDVEVASGVNSASYEYTAVEGDVVFTAEYVGAGGFADSDDELTLTAVDCSDCEESFSYVKNEDGTYTFTYIPAEDMEDALLTFTFPQIALDGNPLHGWSYDGQTMQTTMDLEACEIYEWTVSLTCKDLSNPQNKWTDFKVGIDSKKEEFILENIKCDD